MSEFANIPANVMDHEIDAFVHEWARKEVTYEKMRKYFADNFSKIEADNKTVMQINMPLEDFQILQKYNCSDELQIEIHKRNIEIGIYGKFWGATIYIKPQFDHIEFLTSEGLF